MSRHQRQLTLAICSAVAIASLLKNPAASWMPAPVAWAKRREISTTAKFYTDTTMADLRAGLERTESQKKPQTEIGMPPKRLEDKA